MTSLSHEDYVTCGIQQSWNNISPNNNYVLIQTKYTFMLLFYDVPFKTVSRLSVYNATFGQTPHSSYNHASSPICAVGSFMICITWHAFIILLIISINAAFQIQYTKQTNVFRVNSRNRLKMISGNRKRWYRTTENLTACIFQNIALVSLLFVHTLWQINRVFIKQSCSQHSKYSPVLVVSGNSGRSVFKITLHS